VILDQNKLSEVVKVALIAVRGNKRWTAAINKAMGELVSNPFIHWTGHSLLIWSASNEIYESNGICQCKAYSEGQPCRHRAAYKLVKRYMETAMCEVARDLCGQIGAGNN
jgi:hypothetical protein